MKKEALTKYLESGAGIPLVLNSYEDIFSDFDPRPYSNRALSGDFLQECQKASIEKSDKIRLRLFLPKNKRNPLEEIKIKKRLKEHFHKHFITERKEMRGMKVEGSFWIFLGAIMMVVGTYLSNQSNLSFGIHLLITLVQPAGWFFLWEGLGKILISPKENESHYDFYKKMANAEISFANC